MDPEVRYFSNDEPVESSFDAHEELLASLERINTFNPPVQTCSTGWTFNGLYGGPTSIAYMFYHLHAIYPDLNFKGQSFWNWAEAYLELSKHVPKPEVDAGHCGILSETLAYCTVKAIMIEDPSLVTTLCSYSKTINGEDSGANEWVYGRAGYLYYLRLARSVFTAGKHASAFKLLNETISATIERILEQPQPWIFYNRHYLGAGHGDIGITCQIVLSSPQVADRLQDLVVNTLDQQFPSGNFPSYLPADPDVRVQFCHGGPGFILSLTSMLPHFPSLKTRIEDVISKASQDVFKRGLLTKEPNLCHGIAGNALTLGSHEQLRQFLAHMTSKALEAHDWMRNAGVKDEFVGLWEGEAGRAWAWAVLDRKLPMNCIGYNDI